MYINNKNMKDVPISLRTWFIIHFVVDMVFAIPLLMFPRWTLALFGIPVLETLTVRLVAAALIGIGGVSFLVRNEKKEVFDALLSLKILWSVAALVAIALYLVEGGVKRAWLFFVIFLIFFIIWTSHKVKLGKN